LSSEWLDAEACLDAGLALEVVDDDTLLAHTLDRAQTLARLPLSSLEATKSLIMAPLKDQLKASASAENAKLAELAGGPANREAISAFRDKRTPDFSALQPE
jgi:enoyl-CoA hydratase/carnithine racemase